VFRKNILTGCSRYNATTVSLTVSQQFHPKNMKHGARMCLKYVISTRLYSATSKSQQYLQNVLSEPQIFPTSLCLYNVSSSVVKGNIYLESSLKTNPIVIVVYSYITLEKLLVIKYSCNTISWFLVILAYNTSFLFC
jgi:hypothetical protein